MFAFLRTLIFFFFLSCFYYFYCFVRFLVVISLTPPKHRNPWCAVLPSQHQTTRSQVFQVCKKWHERYCGLTVSEIKIIVERMTVKGINYLYLLDPRAGEPVAFRLRNRVGNRNSCVMAKHNYGMVLSSLMHANDWKKHAQRRVPQQSPTVPKRGKTKSKSNT